MRVLVTGAAGFIGSHLVDALLAEHGVLHVRGVDSLITGRIENLAASRERIEFIQGDLLDPAVCRQAVAGVDVIFHQAAIPSVPRSVEKPMENHLHGCHMTVQLLEEARKAGVKRVVFAASSSAYGDTEVLPKTEEMPPNPLSPYAASKVACEQYMKAYARCYAMDAVCLRYFNIFGPRQDPSSPYSGVIARFCEAFTSGSPLVIYGDGRQTRDFVYVANAVRANILAAKASQRMNGEIINIGIGTSTSLLDLLAVLNDLSGQNRTAEMRPTRAGDVQHSLADISKARKLLGFEPTIDLREGLKRTFDWYRSMA